LEKLHALSSELYHTTIRIIESHVIMKQKFFDPKNFMLWHDRLGHPGAITIQRIIENSYGYTLKSHVQLVLKENLLLSNHLIKLPMKFQTFYNGFKGIYVDQFIYLLDHLVI